MSVLKINLHVHAHAHHRHRLNLRPPNPHFLLLTSRQQTFSPSPPVFGPLHTCTDYVENSKLNAATPFSIHKNNQQQEEIEDFEDYLAEDGEVYQKTLRLVECAMFAAVSALAFLLSNSLAIEVFIFCFSSFLMYIFFELNPL